MSYHSHILNSSSHSHIIGRTDPITGDLVQQNDSVVFCAVCKSCFLEDSWKYMEEKHCQQFRTLKIIPVLQSRLIIKRGKEMIAELISQGADLHIVFLTMLLSFLISFFGLLASDVDYAFLYAIFISGVVAVLSSFITSRSFFKELTGENKSDVRLFKNRIEIGKDSFSWNDVKQIKYQRESEIHYTDNGIRYGLGMPSLLIYFESGKFLIKGLATKDHQRVEVFLKGLEKISHFKEVFFYSESSIEFRSIINIQSQSKGNIQVGDSRRLH
ncbi:hypothetical protein V9L05_16860 [Bernardetia sp. Wsw4-3y2]|uniref:hypothetical protein n=1 Tax=Bernardetia sp. Wsw4-3y2 TaxID=3127471 RepID=UPI0030CF01B7